MSKGRILCNLGDLKEMELWVKVAESSMKSSSYNTVLGVPTYNYYDVDEFLLGREKKEEYNHKRNEEYVQSVTEKFIKMIELVETDCQSKIDKIAFIDKGGVGPVGMISFLAIAAANANKEILIVRPRKRLIRASIKGELRKGENVLIVSDIATSGSSIYLAAHRIWSLGGKVPCALVLVDREAGASENLEQYGIKLYAVIDSGTLASKSKAIKKATKEDKQEKFYIDFGGYSITSAYSTLKR